MTISPPAIWIGADWGTSRCRAFAFDAVDQVIDTADGGPGMNALAADAYEAALLTLIGAWLSGEKQTPVLVCGMAGARQGWREAPYRPLPCDLTGSRKDAVGVATIDPRLRATILPGIAQSERHLPDVMRGEETQLLGFATQAPDFDGLVCLPGTHSKWARLEIGTIERFQTFMTGELFDLLTTRSILRFSTQRGTPNAEAFRAAVMEAAQPEAPLSARLFQIRAQDLLFDSDPTKAGARLSGLLIGDEIRSALADHGSAGPIGLVGDDALCDLYEDALATLRHETLRVSGTDAVIGGLRCAYRALYYPEGNK